MDPDAPPLVKADTLASQGEQLSSRRAYQQAVAAHTEAAKQYQLAAHATADTAAGKALLLQRDKQLKLAEEVRRKLDRLKTASNGGGSSSNKSRSASNQVNTAGSPTPTGLTGPSKYATSRVNAAGQSSSHLTSPGGVPPRSSRQPLSPSAATTMLSHYQYQQQGMASTSTSAMLQGVGRLQGNFTSSQRERVDASIMGDSRYSRKSNSPSQSQISQTIPHSGDSARASSSVEESYYLMQDENDPADPFSAFLNNVENMVQRLELGNAVAFASAPLHVDTLKAAQNDGTGSGMTNAIAAVDTGDSQRQQAIQSQGKATILDSFYVVPSVGKPKTMTTGPSNATVAPTSFELAKNKTHEELVAENVTLKETLDGLSKKYDWLLKERQRERDTLKESVTHFARDVRRQAERLGQSTANLADTRRQMPPALPTFPAAQVLAHTSTGSEAELHKRIAALQEELRLSKLETEKQASLAQKSRAKFDDLRKAILEKRKAKEAATADAAKSARGDQGDVTTPNATSTEASTAANGTVS